MRILSLLVPLTLSLASVHAWAGQKGRSLDRRGFLSTSAAASIAAVATSTSIAAPASAASSSVDPVYTPSPHSLDNQVVVITGGTTGLGLESAKRLAVGGATVVLTSRTSSKGMAAVSAVQEYLRDHAITNPNIYSVQLDLDDLSNVKTFPKRLESTVPKLSTIDTLMNNAGVMAVPDRQLTKDGYEKTFQSNHLGHFVLTSELFPMLNKKGARVINVSSSAHQIAGNGLDLSNINGEVKYGPWISYGQSKLENILFTKELQRRANEAGLDITAVSLHPGAVQTDLSRYMMGMDNFEKMKQEDSNKSWKTQLLQKTLNTLGVLPVEQGATTQTWLAAGQGNKKDIAGAYLENCRVVKPAAAANDMQKAKELWALSEKLGGVEFKI